MKDIKLGEGHGLNDSLNHRQGMEMPAGVHHEASPRETRRIFDVDSGYFISVPSIAMHTIRLSDELHEGR